VKPHPPIYRCEGTDGTNPALLFDRVRIADSIWSKSCGLMFRKRMDYALLFPLGQTRCLITNLFVFQTIDLVFLNRDKRVIGIRRAFKPFTPFHAPPRQTAWLIETPPAAAPDLHLGAQLIF
jgi:uncharacterized membrane protein (UPF0127 family)